MIDTEKAKEEFKNYVENYDNSNDKIKLKINHTYRVADYALDIAKSLKLDETKQKLAWLIGLLHDIGRFEQIRIYNTFSDSRSVDHAELGVSILFEEGYIRRFIDEDCFDKIILKAVKNHNKYEIEEGLTEEELLYAKIARDADKLDIFNIIITENLDKDGNLKKVDFTKEKLNKEVYDTIFNKKIINYKDVDNDNEHPLIPIGYMFDINFIRSFEIIKEKKYVDKLISRLECEDEETKEKIEEITEFVNKYIDDKINKG